MKWFVDSSYQNWTQDARHKTRDESLDARAPSERWCFIRCLKPRLYKFTINRDVNQFDIHKQADIKLMLMTVG